MAPSSSSPSSTTLPLPHHTSPDITLHPATPAENHAQTLANSAEWSGALSQKVYLRREAHLLAQELTREGGLRAWVLIDSSAAAARSSSSSGETDDGGGGDGGDDDDATRRGRILCGCETLRKRALVREPDGMVREVVAYGVCSVFCREEFRGRGYAGRMMGELGRALEEGWESSGHHDDDDVDGGFGGQGKRPRFSVLYSDIGKKFYAARGWRAFPSTHIVLPAASSADPSPAHEDKNEREDSLSLPPAQLLRPADLPALCALDERTLHARLSHLPPPSSSSQKRRIVSLIPDHSTIAWHHARENFFAREFLHLDAEPEIKGALVHLSLSPSTTNTTTTTTKGISSFPPPPPPPPRIWCYWNRTFTATPRDPVNPNTLFILRWGTDDESVAGKLQVGGIEASGSAVEDASDEAAPDGSEDEDEAIIAAVQSLLHAARVQAYEWGMWQVQMWSPSRVVVEAARRVMSSEDGKVGGVEVVEREEDSIASLRWFGEGRGEEDDEVGKVGAGAKEVQVEWWGNEKFGWC